MNGPQSTTPVVDESPPLLGANWVWKAAIGGIAAIAIAAVGGAIADMSKANVFALDVVRLLLTVAGIFAAGFALSCSPRDPRMLGLGAAGCFASFFAFPQAWDSGRMLAIFGTVIATICCVLMCLPQKWRRFGVSLLVLAHFGGIVTAVTGPGAQPWLSAQFHQRVYRPYLQFVYLTNAYHFYSPEPGPAHLMWFCIYYENGNTRWIKLPRRPNDITDPMGLSYYRRLSLSEQLHAMQPIRGVPDDAMRARLLRIQGTNGIPLHPEIAPVDQFRPLPDTHRYFLLPGYVRHVASQKENQHDDPTIAIKSIGVYYVEHRILNPEHLQAGADFYDDITYMPYYFGRFDAKGQEIDVNDPLLYWLVPIVYFPKPDRDVPPYHNWKTHPDEFNFIDSVVRHSGSDHKAK
jgi:hypothetical protein